MGSEKTMQCALVPTENRRISGYAVKIGGVGGGGVPLGALQLIDLWDAFDELRARVAELEAKLEESEAWAKVGRAGYRLRQASIAQVMEPGMVNGDSMDTAQFEFEATLAAATKRAGEEPKTG